MTEYKRYQGKSYMIISHEAESCGYEYLMLEKNRIFGLLPLSVAKDGNRIQLWYDISGRRSFEDWIKMKKIGSSFLKTFMAALEEALERIGEHLLYEDGICLLPERIFLDEAKKEVAFCYIPFEKTPFVESLRGFMEYYLPHMQHGNREEAQKCYEVYEKCQQDHVSVSELSGVLFAGEKEADGGFMEMENDAPLPARGIVEKKKERKFLPREMAWNLKGLPFGKKKASIEPCVFEPEEYQEEPSSQTVFLGSETKQTLGEFKYEGDGTGQNIKITKTPFLIGSLKEEADGIISDDTVSRIHARITKEEDGYYLEDMNSTNGTCRNGELLNYKEKVKLEKNDRIAFAKEHYRFV